MTRAALLSLAPIAATSAGHALAATGREVVNLDGGPGNRLVIVRDGAWCSEGRDVLDYTGAAALTYASTPTTR